MGKQKVSDAEIRKMLDRCNGRRGEAAVKLGICESTLTKRLAKMTDVPPPPHRIGYKNQTRIRSTEGESSVEIFPPRFLKRMKALSERWGPGPLLRVLAALDVISARWDPKALIHVLTAHIRQIHGERIDKQRERRVVGEPGAWSLERLKAEQDRGEGLVPDDEGEFEELWPE